MMVGAMLTDITLQAGRRDACSGWRMLITSSLHKMPGYALQSHILVGHPTHVTLSLHGHYSGSQACGTAILVGGQVST